MRNPLFILLALCLAPALAHADASTGVLDASYASRTDVPLTSAGFVAEGKKVRVALNFTPAKGEDLTLVRNTGPRFIQGHFDNLAHGQIVTLQHGGARYQFVANYYGGDGKDLVLMGIDLGNLSAAAQAKLDHNLILALKKSRGEAPFDRPTSLRAEDYEKAGRVLVDITSLAPASVTNGITALGGEVINGWQTPSTLRAWVPFARLEAVADLSAVQSMSAARPSVTHHVTR
jgi:hypothetical protein